MLVDELLQNIVRGVFYPGLDLHTRNRASLCKFWKTGPRDVLDAGSGNGYFSWLAYKSGARVVAVNFEKAQVEKARQFLLSYKKADPTRLQFEHGNLYDLSREVRKFDEIICYETIEHVRHDSEVVNEFFRILRPGGLLHLCAPNRLHPRHQAEVLDTNESGGHVRAGYTEEEFRRLLEPVGFRIKSVTGLGTTAIVCADEFLRPVRSHVGDWLALPFLPLMLPLVRFAKLNPAVPFSLYVCAERPNLLAF
jgi:2-polyprenyl-3-methyl-5-hydroxy-6-metoxy-1,4-benzoquinol methylase